MFKFGNHYLKVVLAVVSAAISGFSTQGAAYDFIVDDIAYKIEDGNAVVTYKGQYSPNTYSQNEVVIPEEVTYKEQTYPVTAIGDYAFYQCYRVESVTIPVSVSEIGKSAFNTCSGLTSLVIPESVKIIGDNALENSGIRTLTLPDCQIGKDAFSKMCYLEMIESPYATSDGKCLIIDGVLRLFARAGIAEYVIPEAVHTIDSYVFNGDEEIEKVTLPSGLVSLGNYAFNGCSLLSSVNIPASVRELGYSVFSGCTMLTSVVIEDMNSYCHISSLTAPIFNADVVFLDTDGEAIYDITFPGDVKMLERGLFYKTSIRSVAIEEGVEEIQYDAFRDCKNLRSVTIPSSVTSIGNAVFRGCLRLSDVVYGAAEATAGYHVKEDREDEHSYIFLDCPSLTHVELTGEVVGIPKYLFASTNIKSITFPATVRNVESSVFYLGQLEEATFEGSPELDAVFTQCNNLRKVTVMTTEPPTVNGSLGAVGSALLYVPGGSVEDYSVADGWSSFKAIVEEVQSGEVGHVFDYEGLRYEITDSENLLCRVTSPKCGEVYAGKIIIPEMAVGDDGRRYSVSAIDEFAFTLSSKVTSIRIPDGISEITGIDNTSAGLTEIIVSEDNPTYRTVDGVLFDKDVRTLLIYPASKPGPYTVPPTVETVGSKLSAKINLEELIISDSVTGNLDMSGSPSLKSLTMGGGVTSFSVANCPALEYLEIGSGVEYVRGENFGAEYHDIWNTRNIRELVFADSPNPIKIYTMSVDDGYIEAIPTSNCKHVYIGRDLEAAGSPLRQHFSANVPHVEFGPQVSRLDAQLILSMQYTTTQITVPTVDFWASTPRMYYGSQPGYSLYVAGEEIPNLYITAENIVQRAFYNVNNIETITLSKDVSSIEKWALRTYSPLKSLILEHADPADIQLDGEPLLDYDQVELSVPYGSKELYENADYWGKFVNIVERALTSLEAAGGSQASMGSDMLYDLQGRQVAPTVARHGVYIRRSANGESEKIRL